jgi:hypothetical protein
MQLPSHLHGKERSHARNQQHHKIEAIKNELEELKAKAWRARGGRQNYTIEARRIQDRELSSTIYGPAMRSWQWKRE